MNRTQIEQMVLDTLNKNAEKLLTPETCKKCGGKCCQNFGCECHPHDFGYNPDKMYSALKTGYYSISFTTTDWASFKQTFLGITLNTENIKKCLDNTLYIRMRNRNRPIVDLIHFGNVEGPCCMWSPEHGCGLSFDERPLYGKFLHPQGSTCVPAQSRIFLKESWREFQDILLQYAKEFLTLEDRKWYITTLGIPFYL